MTLQALPSHHSVDPSSLYSKPFNGAKGADLCNTISVIALSTLFIVTIGFSIHYILHSSANVVAITSNFSISIPLLIFSSIGVFCVVFLLIQVVRCKQVKESFSSVISHILCSSKELQQIIRLSLHLGARTGNVDDKRVKQEIASAKAIAQERLPHHLCKKAEIVEYITRDGFRLRGVWCFNDNARHTVLFFHGNLTRVERELEKDQNPWIEHYLRRGDNVLLVEYRGYGMSEGSQQLMKIVT